MAKKNIKELRLDMKKAGKALTRSLESPKLYKTLGNRLLRILKLNWQKGFGTDDNGKTRKFKDNQPSTKRSRARKKLSSLTTPDTSNMIETGKTWQGTKAKARKGSLSIGPADDKHSKDAIKYNDESNPIFNFNEETQQQAVDQEVEKVIDSVLDKFFG